jgi:hypothetical protein
MTAIHHRTAEVDGLRIFCREAGRTDAPHCSCCMASRAPAGCFAI